ncbi:SEL1-like repeat protein, partial [Rahnella sp. C60]|uniref:SEL1-like repeat protein n=1 Tax=Rahnella perminowiae TaxID=2816244 RepID=UPI001C260436
MRQVLLLLCLLLTACDQAATPTVVKKDITMDPLSNTDVRLAFVCKYEVIPEPSADADKLFKYGRWLQVNNQLKKDEMVDIEIERLYRIASSNNHYKANINLQNGAIRGQFNLTSTERLHLSIQLINAHVATGYYFIAIYLENGSAGLKKDPEMALRYYRKAADNGNPQAQSYVADKLAEVSLAQEIVEEMYYCASKQGDANAARTLGYTLKNRKMYQNALEVFQLGVLAGDETSAGKLSNIFIGPEPTDSLNFMNQQKDPERSKRYKAIWRILANYSYAHPTVPEI